MAETGLIMQEPMWRDDKNDIERKVIIKTKNKNRNHHQMQPTQLRVLWVKVVVAPHSLSCRNDCDIESLFGPLVPVRLSPMYIEWHPSSVFRGNWHFIVSS